MKERVMKERVLIDKSLLEKVRDTALFYPCSRYDLFVPIEVFSPYVTDFWFVDCGYFPKWAPADKVKPVLKDDGRYELLSENIDGPPGWSFANYDITPCIKTECYRHLESDRIIRVHRRRGYGFSALRYEKKIPTLGVFFYRGDCGGEGGSGNWWLEQDHLDDVFDKLIDGGLLALDGSDGKAYRINRLNRLRKRNKKPHAIHNEICKYAYNSSISLTPEELIASMKVVKDPKNREYRCVGYAGMRYGPTMIWQVHGIAQQDAAPERDSANAQCRPGELASQGGVWGKINSSIK